MWLIVWVIMGTACTSHPITEKLNRVESLMWNMPDSAYCLLNEISESSLVEESEKAKYALLMTQAFCRTGSPILSDSLINVAMDYYSSFPKSKDYVLTCLARGNVMEILGNESVALDMYLSASDAKDNLKDRRIHFLVYTFLGNLYVRYGFYREATSYYELALSLNLPTPVWKEVDYSETFQGIVQVHPIKDFHTESWKSLLEKLIDKVRHQAFPFQEEVWDSVVECLSSNFNERDNVEYEVARKRMQEIQSKHTLSILKNKNRELKEQWIITFLITTTVISGLVLVIYEGRKLYRKQSYAVWKQYRKELSDLQSQIDELQELQDENQQLAYQIRDLEAEKAKKELRIRQLEVTFRAKEITIPIELVESAQVYLRIVDRENPSYNPSEDRYKLERWLNVANKQFAKRLQMRFPSLTNGDRDICFLFALNLSFKEVAKVLNVQPRSVERSVCRICQRMGLPQNGKEEFLHEILSLKALD